MREMRGVRLDFALEPESEQDREWVKRRLDEAVLEVKRLCLLI
jgi:hypothetical protein